MSENTPAFTSSGEQVKIVRISSREKEKELDLLPAPNTQRWVTSRKALVVAAVRKGVLSFEEACERYRLSQEEFHSWMHLLDRHGARGLRSTRMQEYRPPAERHPAEARTE